MSLVLYFDSDESERVSMFFPTFHSSGSGGIQPDLTTALAVVGKGSQKASGEMPSTGFFSSSWRNYYPALQMCGYDGLMQYAGQSGVSDENNLLKLTGNNGYTYVKNGRILKSELGVVKVYDSDGETLLYTHLNDSYSVVAPLRYYQIPSVIYASDTISTWRSGVSVAGLNPYTWDSNTGQPIRWQAQVPASLQSTNHNIDWIYYLLHDDENDVTLDDEDDPEPPLPPGPDPYSPYDPSGPSGPVSPGAPYDPGDPIDFPPTPGWDPSDSGFLKIFIPSATTLGLLSSKLWDSNFFETLNKFIADPRDAIISLGCVPFNVTPAGTAEIKVGIIGTGVNSAYVDDPYVDIDCGSVAITPILDGYTDYSPFTDMYLYLPYVGSVQLDTDIYMGKTVNVKYRCDILTGDCLAFVLVGGSVKATYNGNIKFGVPITGADYTQMWNTFLSVTTGALLGAAGAAAAGAEAGAVDVAQGAIKGGAGKLSQSAGIKPQIQISGQVQSTNGLLGVQYPYIEIRRPNLCIPSGQKTIEGYPSLVSVTLSSLSGYTEVEEIHLSVPGATQEELEEIETMLKTGVII